MLDHIKDILDRLTKRQQVILALSTVFSVVGILLMAMVATKTQMSLLYSGMDEISIAELALKLENMKVEYTHRNGAVFVDKQKRDKVRMELARQGLPRKNIQGYELLDDMSGFGTTSEMFQATYWRAKEGEIARTIVTMDEIDDARVHIAPMKKTGFNKNDNTASASVMVKMRGGAVPDKENARAIKYMVALAVGRLNPNKVSVIDASSGLLVGAEDEDPHFAMIQKRIELEHKMSTNLEHLLGAHVGYDKVKVQVAVDMSTKEEIIREKNIDPNSRTVISTATSELNENSNENTPGEVTAGNNIPGDGDGSGAISSNRSEAEEKVNYEVSQTNRESRKSPGDIERISVAVMVDQVETVAEDGTVSYRERTAEELKSLEDLVKSASGINPDRGDVVTVKSLSFVKPPALTAPPHKFWNIIEDNFDLMIEAAALLLSIAGISFGVVRPILRMGGDSKHKEEIAKLRAMYEEQIQALLPEEVDEEEINPMQLIMSDLEDAINADPEESLMVIRQWLHAADISMKDTKDDMPRKRSVVTEG